MTILFAAALSVSACMFGDDFFRVSGKIVNAEGEPVEGCTLALDAIDDCEDAYPFSWEETASEIERTFVWPFDRTASYRLAVSCPGFPAPLFTEIFVVGDAIRKFPEPVDLGTIVMKENAAPNSES